MNAGQNAPESNQKTPSPAIDWTDGVREALKAIPDLARALGRVVAGRGSPRDLGQLRDGLGGARSLRERLGCFSLRSAFASI